VPVISPMRAVTVLRSPSKPFLRSAATELFRRVEFPRLREDWAVRRLVGYLEHKARRSNLLGPYDASQGGWLGFNWCPLPDGL
jgi:hypothetical protein